MRRHFVHDSVIVDNPRRIRSRIPKLQVRRAAKVLRDARVETVYETVEGVGWWTRRV